MSDLTFGAGLFPTEPVPRMVQLARVSEELGFSNVWVGDSHLIWGEAFVNLAAAAANTSRVILGTGVTNPLTRHPAVLASGFATLEQMAPGRVAIGIGLGDSSVETMGMRPARLAAFEEALRQMRTLLAGEELTLETGSLWLKHAPQRSIPFVLAASGPRMLELAGRIADGVIMLVGTTPRQVRKAIDRVDAGAQAAGRNVRDLQLVLWVPCAVSGTRPARDAVKAHVARVVAHPLPFALDPEEERVLGDIRRAYDYYQHMEQGAAQAKVIPDWLVDRFAIAGTVQECRTRIEALRDTGISQVAIIPYGVGGDGRDATLRGFAEAAGL